MSSRLRRNCGGEGAICESTFMKHDQHTFPNSPKHRILRLEGTLKLASSGLNFRQVGPHPKLHSSWSSLKYLKIVLPQSGFDYVMSDWYIAERVKVVKGQNGRRIIGQAVAWQRRDATIRDITLEVEDQQPDVS